MPARVIPPDFSGFLLSERPIKMAISLPNGTTYSVASAYGTAINVTAASNAAECVLTATNTLAMGDLVEYTSTWPRANGRVFRVKAATGTTATLESFDTTSTANFPAGGGTGSIRKITTWVPIPYMVSFEVSGGDPKYTTAEFVDYPDEISLPNGFSATSVTMTIADDPTLPHHAVLKAATDAGKPTAVRASLPSGAPILYSGTIALNETPTMSKGQVMSVKCGMALQGRPVRYAS
jgi:hypothetical protein